MPASSALVRAASARDAVACLGISRPYVDTIVSWEIEVPTVSEMSARIEAAHEWLVLEHDRRIIGFAYGHTLHRLAAFQWSTETGIYIDVNHQRAGSGRTLYAELLRRLTARGYRQAFAGITQPNEASNAFHQSFGFTDAGLYRRVEWKHDSWHDVAWMQLDLLGTAAQDEPPRPIV
jgi:L-amino acid N-acyltransferase YncA